MTHHGPRMLQAAAYVARHPGCAILPVARFIAPRGPNGTGRPGLQFGYRAVHRAIAAGLITAERGAGNAYRLTPPRSA